MSDTEPGRGMSDLWWEEDAYMGIVGLGPAPADGEVEWPTHGYDGRLHDCDWDNERGHGETGRSRADWLLLADAMIARWQEWRAQVEALPPEFFNEPKGHD